MAGIGPRLMSLAVSWLKIESVASLSLTVTCLATDQQDADDLASLVTNQGYPLSLGSGTPCAIALPFRI